MSSFLNPQEERKADHRSIFWLNTKSKPINQERVEQLMKTEWELFQRGTLGSKEEFERAVHSTPLGVTSSFQHWKPYPISIVSGEGAYLVDSDGRRMLDLSMGFGAMMAGHLNPLVVKELTKSLSQGTLFVSPSPTSRQAAEQICERFGLDQIRFTNSGSESTMYAVRLAKAYSSKPAIIKVEGGYHGSYDPFQVSCKPNLSDAGDGENPTPVLAQAGCNPGEVFVVPYNNLPSLEKILKEHHQKISCFILEPVLQNISLVVPDEGYLQGVRDLCTQYDVILIFDEVKTGLTAGPRGTTGRVGVAPDLICLAKSIGAGVPVGAFGGKKKYMDAITDGRFCHCGTFNGSPIAMAGVRAMNMLCTDEAIMTAESFNAQALYRIQDIIQEYELPAQICGFGVKGAIQWSTKRVRNYRDYKATDFKVAELHWLWMVNRNIITPPGLDEQWLISLSHGQTEVDLLVEDFRSFAKALRQQ